MNRKNLIIIGAIALVIAGVALAAWLTRPQAAPPAAPEAAQEPADGIRAYLAVTTSGGTKIYPLTKSGRMTVRQKSSGATNVIRVTPDSVEMASSTCENQLCVHEGVVTLDNKADRILGSFIYCLPNNVTLELMTAEEYEKRK